MVTFTRKDQQVVLDLLAQFGAVREDQAEKILRFKFPKATLERTIFPMLSGRTIRRSNGYLFPRSGKLDERTIEAIDIMLLIGPDPNEAFVRGTDPFALTFFKWRGEKLWRYDICPVAYGTEAMISAKLENLPAKYRMLVFVPEKEEQMQGIHVGSEHCYVLKKDSSYEFYLYRKKGE